MRLIFLLLLFSSTAWADRPPIPGPALVAPIIVEGQRQEQAWIFPQQIPNEFKIEATPLFRLWQKYLPEEEVQLWRQRVQPQGVFSFQQLMDAGFEPRFDEKTLDIYLKIPSESRSQKEIALIKRGIDTSLPVAPSAPYSGYLNFRGSNYFIYPSSSATRQPFAGNFELVNQLFGWSLEGGYDYTEKNEYEWRRTDTSLIHDFEESSWRLRIGDVQTSTMGYQASRAMGGISLAKIFAIQPYAVSRPISRTEIMLERPATVEVFINGVRVNQLRLPAGPVNLKDFPPHDLIFQS
jgi:outer membrane usher protein